MNHFNRFAILIASGSLILGCAVGGDDPSELSGDNADRVPVNDLASDTWQLARAAADDLAGGQLISGVGLERAVNDERAPVSLSWAFDGENRAGPAPGDKRNTHVASSREFRMRVSALELAEGVELPLSSPAAMVKLSAQSTFGIASFEPGDIELTDASGTIYTGEEGMELMVSSEQVTAAGVGFPPGTTLFRVSEALGSGPLTMAWNGLAEADPTLDAVIQVRETGSPVAFELEAGDYAYLQGQDIEFHARWSDANATPIDDRVFGTLYGPDGAEYALELGRDGGEFRGAVQLPEVEFEPGTLWMAEVEARARMGNGTEIARTVRTAFSYAQKTAELTGEVHNDTGSESDDIAFSFGVDVGSRGRYAVTAVLYGSAVSGALEPIAVAQSAAFLEPGAQRIEMSFARATVAESGLSAPFEVRDFTLVDQTRVGLLRRQATVLAFE